MKNRGLIIIIELPKLLKQAINGMGLESEKKNSIAGFKACGIHTFNRQAVIAKFPEIKIPILRIKMPRQVQLSTLENNLKLLLLRKRREEKGLT